MPESTLLFDDTRPSFSGGGHRPLSMHVWRPAGEGPHPTVLLSHGTGGAAIDLAWLAEPLAEAGFLVAGVDHHGNSYLDEYLPEGFAFVWERPRDLTRLLDHLVAAGDADPARVGAVGFSLGGYTVAAVLGARVDLDAAWAVLSGAVEGPPVREFPGLVPALRARHPDERLREVLSEGVGSMRDARVRAGFLVAPAVAELLDPASLDDISAPIEVRWGDADPEAFPPHNAHVYVARMPKASGASVGAGVGHYVFIADEPDPGGVRDGVARDAVAFFSRELAA